jgi:hypothetical protein
MKISIQSDPTCPIKRVYDTAVNQHNVPVDTCPEFHSVRTQLARCRAFVLPEVAHDIDDVIITGEWGRTWSGKNFLSHIDNAWGILIFATSKCLKLLHQCQQLYIDGTFRTSPTPYTQFVTIHGFFHDRVVPLIFCLLTGKQIGQYRQLLKHVKNRVRQLTGHKFRPRQIVCDFESSLITAIETELPRCKIQGCYFHFCQSLWRKIQELGLSGPYRRRKHLRHCLRKLMAIGYLPLAIVRQNFNVFSTSNTIGRIRRRYPEITSFIQYLNRTYMGPNALFPTIMWNVFDRNQDNRTNNYVESKYFICCISYCGQ